MQLAPEDRLSTYSPTINTFPRPGESDAGLTAAKNDFAVRSQHKLFLVCLDGQVSGFGFRGLDRAKNNRQRSIAVFESQDCLLANFFFSEQG